MESSHWENHLFCHKMSLSLSISRYRKSRVWLYISNKNVADETGLWNIKLMINNTSSCQTTINRNIKKHQENPVQFVQHILKNTVILWCVSLKTIHLGPC